MRILTLRVMSWLSLFGGAILTPYVWNLSQNQNSQDTFSSLFAFYGQVFAITVFVSGVFWWAILGLAANVAEKVLSLEQLPEPRDSGEVNSSH